MSKVDVQVHPKFSVDQALEILEKNDNNRPVRRSLVTKYKTEILRGKWLLNGETAVIDSQGQIVSAQHRLLALVAAEEARKKNVAYYREKYGWKGSVTIPLIVVTGVDPKTADTVDIGQTRSGGDVLYRKSLFSSDYKERQQATLSKTLANAARLVWLRCGGKKISDAPSFPHSELLDFVSDNPTLIDSVEYIYKADEGSERRIRSFLSLGVASALQYLFAYAKWDEDDPDAEPELWEESCKFFDAFATGVGLEKNDPVLMLRNYLTRVQGSDNPLTRDALVSTVIKAWNHWIDDEKMTATNVRLKKEEDPHVGGLDVAEDTEEEDE